MSRWPSRAAAVAMVLGLALSGAEASVVDAYGQRIEPALDAYVEENRELRLPYNKTRQQAAADARTAAKALQRIVARHPGYFRAWFNLALAQNEAGDYEAAMRSFDRAIAIRDRRKIADVSVLNSAGWASLNNGDYGTAEKYLLRALDDIELGSAYTKAAVHTNLGHLYFFTQRIDEAEKHLRRAGDLGAGPALRTLDIIERMRGILEKSAQKKP